MRLPVTIVFAAFVGFLATPAFASLDYTTADPAAQPPTGPGVAPTTAQKPVTVASADDPNAIVCRREELTGSRIPGPKTCLPRHAWGDMADEARTDTGKSQTNGFQTPFQHPLGQHE